MKSANPWKRIYDAIGEAASVEMLAEEASELAAAAQKLARVIRGENPARVDRSTAEDKMIDEIADVFNALDVLDTGVVRANGEKYLLVYAKRRTFRKMKRWYKSLFPGEAEE